MTKTLRNLGFEVMQKNNAGLRSMQLATAEFARKIANYDVALFFYAGHGIQVDGENYLVPVDAKLDDKTMCQFEAFNVNFINKAFQANGNNLNVMILDACRNNPLRSWMRGGGRGFKVVSDQAAGTLIAFATREGETASDGTGINGLFTEKLVKQMNKAQNITVVFQNTRVEVLAASNKTQCPQEWNMLTGNFYFKKPSGNNISEVGGFEPSAVVYEYGSISIDSKIAGSFYLDGNYKGSIKANSSGNKLTKITTGTHILKIDGEETWEKTIVVNKDRTTYLTIKSNKAKDLPGYLNDPRDGKSYKTVDIVGQIWMAENLAYKASSGYWAYNNDQSNVAKYGYLYDWETAKTVCPSGWHLPSKADYEKLLNSYGGASNTEASYIALIPEGESGFSALFGGYRYDGGYYYFIGKGGLFWSSSSRDGPFAWKLLISSSNYEEADMHASIKSWGFSVRCLRE